MNNGYVSVITWRNCGITGTIFPQNWSSEAVEIAVSCWWLTVPARITRFLRPIATFASTNQLCHILRDGRHSRTNPTDSQTHRTNKHTITPRNNAATRSYSTLFDKNDAFTRLKGHERRTLPVIISPLYTVYWATGPRKVAVVSIISLITHLKRIKWLIEMLSWKI